MKRLLFIVVLVALVAAVGCEDSTQEVDDTGVTADTHTQPDVGSSGDAGGDASADADPQVDPDASEADTSTPDTSTADTSEADTSTADTSEADCVPDRRAWNQHASAIVDEHCSKCHGSQPDFGAPFSLTDYDDLINGPAGQRKVDLMANELLVGDMPPPGEQQLDHADLDTLVGWATCGEEHPDYSEDLWASEPVWSAPADPPAGAEQFDVTADEFEVGTNTLDRYQCFVVEAPISTERFIKRFDPAIDDSRVLHHMLVTIDRDSTRTHGDSFRCSGFPPGDEYVYGWGPGTEPIEFEDGGLSIEPGDKFILQIHYNNGAGATDVRDSSGFRVHHAAPGGTEYGLGAQSTLSIFVPPNSTAQAQASCTVSQNVSIRASWPHMHEIGSEFETIIKRQDGTEETLIELTGWHFEAQFIYDTPAQLYPGDELITTCTYDNPHDHSVNFGLGTGDEMCFNFLYLSPALDSPCQ